MKKIGKALAAGALLWLSGCVGSGPGLSDRVPLSFGSVPMYFAGGSFCGSPLPHPTPETLFPIVRKLAGPGGRASVVKIPGGIAFGVWTDRKTLSIVRSLARAENATRPVRIHVRLKRLSRKTPLIDGGKTVRTRRPFLAARWRNGAATMSVYGYFIRTGTVLTPLFDFERRNRSTVFCTSAAPGSRFSDISSDISFGTNEATFKAGTETLEVRWKDRKDDKNHHHKDNGG